MSAAPQTPEEQEARALLLRDWKGRAKAFLFGFVTAATLIAFRRR